MPTVVEQYQVAGLDERERGFNRQVNLEQVDGGIRAVLRYEKVLVETTPAPTSGDAVQALIELLRARGYSHLRSRVNFRGGAYLGTQQPWTEHDDPATCEPAVRQADAQLARRSGWIGTVMKLFGA